MIKFSVNYSVSYTSHQIYIRYSQTEDEEEDLERLVRETVYICQISEKTGLRILQTFTYKERICVLMYLGDKIKTDEIKEQELCSQVKAILEEKYSS